MPHDSVITQQAIEDLRALSPDAGGEFLRELIEIYLQDIPERIGELELALASGDPILLTRAAHTIKGSSSNFGAVRLSKVAHEIEMHGKAGDLAAAGAARDRLKSEYALVAAELKRIAQHA